MSMKLKKKRIDSIPFFTPSGVSNIPVYERVLDDDFNRKIVKKTKTFDVNEFIQASNATTDLSQLRQEMLASGLLPQVSKDVVDYTLFPKDIHETFDVVNTMTAKYNALPDSIKKVFPDVDSFQNSLIKGNFESDIVAYYQAHPIQNVTTKEEPKNE